MLAAVDPIVIDAEHAPWSRIDDDTTTIVRLDDGDARIHVDHPTVPRRLVVLVPDSELDDVGTTFLVRIRDGRNRGRSRGGPRHVLARSRSPMLLTAGERWVIHDPVAVMSPRPSPSPSPPPSVATPRRIPSPPSTPVHEAGSAAGSATAPIDDQLRDAISSLDAGDPTGASKKLREIVARYPSDPQAEDAAYLLAIALQRASDAIGARAAARITCSAFRTASEGLPSSHLRVEPDEALGFNPVAANASLIGVRAMIRE